VYDRTVNEKLLTLCVSGQLWNRSLVMLDIETKSLWSHILGEAMAGELKGQLLKPIPSDMVTWVAWKRDHPKTTVLDMSRSDRAYTSEFYRDPQRFVLGFSGNLGMQHCSFATLMRQPVLNTDARGLPLLITFDKASTSARIFLRKLDGQVLTFVAVDQRTLRDDQTKSVWNRATGLASAGSLKGKRLSPHVGIVSFTKTWKKFHPDSKSVE
jgi:hypothetical protein